MAMGSVWVVSLLIPCLPDLLIRVRQPVVECIFSCLLHFESLDPKSTGPFDQPPNNVDPLLINPSLLTGGVFPSKSEQSPLKPGAPPY